MATPIVSGAVALILQANPKLTPNMVKMILMYTAQPLAGFNHLEQGAGTLNIEGAVRLAKLVRQDLTELDPARNADADDKHIADPKLGYCRANGSQWSQGIILDNGYAQGTKLITRLSKGIWSRHFDE